MQKLVVSPAYVQTSGWAQAAFENKERSFPNWMQVELRFRDDHGAVLSLGVEEAAKAAKAAGI
jgi:hypothetical protein